MSRRLLILIAAVACAPRGAVEQGSSIAIRNVTVIPMTASGSLAGQTVVVRDGRIAEIGPVARLRVPAGATVVDGTGKYLIPGLFEMHAHMSKTRASALGLYVVHGVTTIRDQGSEHEEVVRWRRQISAGTRVGPRMRIAGPYLESLRNIERMRRDPPESRVEPFERARIPVGSPMDARRVIDSLAALELDHFKVRTVQDRETYLALTDAARRRGKRLVGHVVFASPALFLEAGQEGVDHGFPVAIDSLPREERMAFWRQLATRDVGVVPTYFERYWPTGLKHIREMREAGVRIMAGSDVAVLNIFPGASLHEELRLFVDSVGMSPMEALASATRKPAEWLRLSDSVGTIEAGKVADLMLLDANPLDDITNTRRIAAVVLRGRLFQRHDLDALLAAVAGAPDRRANDWVR